MVVRNATAGEVVQQNRSIVPSIYCSAILGEKRNVAANSGKVPIRPQENGAGEALVSGRGTAAAIGFSPRWSGRGGSVVALAALADAVFIGAVCAEFHATPPDDKRSPFHCRNWSRLRPNRDRLAPVHWRGRSSVERRAGTRLVEGRALTEFQPQDLHDKALALSRNIRTACVY